MNHLKKIIEHFSNPLTIELPAEYENRKLEIVISELQEDEARTDLSAFFGKLQWRGNALAEQKKMRDEWE